MILGIFIPVIFIILSSYIIWKSTDSFETAADYLGRNMSHGVKGATLNAVASSMPEFLTTMFFLFYVKEEGAFADNFSGGLGVTAGSAVFNILIIPFAILFFGSIKMKAFSFPVNKAAIGRDGLFLIFANVILLFIIRQKKLDILDGSILVIIYLLYIFLLRKGFGRRKNRPEEDREHRIPYLPLKIKHFLLLDINRILLNGRKLNTLLAWITLFISTIVMSLGTWLLVEGTELLGKESYSLFGIDNLHGLGIPIIFLSVVFAAAATSIPDTMISIRDARKSNHIDSISNALGSNIFDISFALGFPLLIYTIMNQAVVMSLEVRMWSMSVWILMFIINLIVFPLFYFSKTINRRKGFVLISLYILFILFIIEESILSHVSNLVILLLE
ncbi:MAG: sodium:calcium antiporter [Bacteroidota bacterium]